MGIHRYVRCAAVRRAAIVVLLLLAAPSLAKAQQSAKPEPADSIAINTNVVSLRVTVLDSRERYVTGLDKSAFAVFEDKVRQEISHFNNIDTPLSVGIVFDLSGSMNETKLGRARESLARFIQSSHEQDEYSLIGFNEKAWVAVDRTRDSAALLRQFSGVRPKGETALYDAVALGVEQLAQGGYPRRALLIISDGEDNRSRTTLARLRKLLQEADAAVYAIGINDFPLPHETGRATLRDLAALTGGKAFFPGNREELFEAFEQIAQELRSQYSLGYTPTNFVADGKWRKLKVEVAPPPNSPRLVVRSRVGYYATADKTKRAAELEAGN